MAPSASGDDLNDELISLIKLDLVRLGEVYGFSFGIVKKSYMLLGTFEKTVKFLQALKAVMVDMEDQVYENCFGSDDSSSGGTQRKTFDVIIAVEGLQSNPS